MMMLLLFFVVVVVVVVVIVLPFFLLLFIFNKKKYISGKYQPSSIVATATHRSTSRDASRRVHSVIPGGDEGSVRRP